MGYGARAKKVPAISGGKKLGDVNIFKLGVVGKFERGFKGLVQKGIYNTDDFAKKCGGLGEGVYLSPYVVQSFLDELDPENPVEMSILGHVADNATNAVGVLNDSNGTPAKLWD